MTAMNIIVGTKAAYVLTDSVLYRPTGEIAGFGRKAAVASEAQIIVATRGDSRLPSSLAEAIDEAYSSIDDVLIDEGDALRWRYDQTVEQFGDGPAPVQFALVGWSEDQGCPIGVMLVLDETGWSFTRIDGGIAAPLPSPTELSQLRLLRAAPGEHWEADDFSPTAHGIPLLEAQRRMFIPMLPGGPKGHAVGGEVLLSVLTKDGIKQDVIHSWDDQIGTPIRPARFTLPITPGMSRQVRRARERQARRA